MINKIMNKIKTKTNNTVINKKELDLSDDSNDTVDDNMGISFSSHIVIRDKNTQQELVNRRDS